MLEKLKNCFKEKDEKKRTDNLIAFLIILVITLIVINKILKTDSSSNKKDFSNTQDVELVSKDFENVVEESNSKTTYDLEEKLEEILSNMQGVGKVSVLLTYQESTSIKPIYNESTSSSLVTDSGGTTTETKTESKDVFTNSKEEAVLEKKISPKLEGAIVIAEGARGLKYKDKYNICGRGSNRTS